MSGVILFIDLWGKNIFSNKKMNILKKIPLTDISYGDCRHEDDHRPGPLRDGD